MSGFKGGNWRKDFKGLDQVAGWMGKGKSNTEDTEQHQSAPLSSLKDPSSFGPPPKRGEYRSAAAAPSHTNVERSGIGAPLSHEELGAQQRQQQATEAQAMAEEEANRPPPGPYRVDTTGLNTAHLPKPPVRRLDQESASTTTSQPRAPPRLPPRLPPRQNSHPDAYAPPPPPPYTESAHGETTHGQLNQGALHRLGQAGVSVPGLDIGRTTSPPVPPRQAPSPASSANRPTRGPQLGELQSKFSKLSTSPSSPQPASTGTSFADKQAAFKTANALSKDPSTVSTSDIKNAASTANNFRERHGDQAASGWQKANSLDQKYGLAERANAFASGGIPTSQNSQLPGQAALGKKAPPPPPPPKRKDALGARTDARAAPSPPPIPLASKPNPSG